jgi:biotin carboxylase
MNSPMLYLLALNPTDSVSVGFLPAAEALGLDVTLLTDQPDSHRRRHPNLRVQHCEVRAVDAVVAAIATGPTPATVFTNSDHLQVQAALAAAYFGVPGKDWRAALGVKNKAEMRRRLAAAGLDAVWHTEVCPDQDLAHVADREVPFPCVVKPREGVASEDVMLVDTMAELVLRCTQIRQRRSGVTLIVEEYLDGELYTVETLGDGHRRHVLGGFRTSLSPPPQFIELGLTFIHAHSASITDQVLAQLDALDVGFGACHTEFVVRDGRARLIEVNYRAIGDQCDLLLQHVLGIPLFEHILRTHLGEALPSDLGIRAHRAARIDYPCALRSGTLTAAPAAADLVLDGVDLTYRPLREVGERHELSQTNRDYVGVLRSVGTDPAAVDLAAERFLANQRWEVVA